LDKTINFVERKSIPFTEKVELLIPITEIRGYSIIKIEEHDAI
jgi:hypothetical protein